MMIIPEMEQFETLEQKPRLDIEIDLLISSEARRSIDLDYPRLHRIVDEYIEAENLEANALRARYLTWSTHFVCVKEVWLGDE